MNIKGIHGVKCLYQYGNPRNNELQTNTHADMGSKAKKLLSSAYCGQADEVRKLLESNPELVCKLRMLMHATASA